MKKFEKLRIIEAGETANSYEEGGKTYKLVISASAFPSLVAVGNSRPIHARRTHNGADLLDGYVGYLPISNTTIPPFTPISLCRKH